MEKWVLEMHIQILPRKKIPCVGVHGRYCRETVLLPCGIFQDAASFFGISREKFTPLFDYVPTALPLDAGIEKR